MDTPRLLFALACLPVLGCSAEHLPPPAAPAREVPQVDVPVEPPAHGTGRIVLETNGERAKVVEVTGSAMAASGGYRATVIGLRPLCTTPCVVDLPYGSHPLLLASTTDATRTSELELEVGAKPKVVRHTLGERKDGGAARTVGATLLTLGVTAALTGALLWGIGAAVSDSGHDSGLVGPGQILTASGGAGILFAVPLLIVGRPTERPGATTEWTPDGTEPRRALPSSTAGREGPTRL